MSVFSTRYHTLNAAQKEAVDTIDGPLMVIAGPGTGKTELLSMRVANILQKTDTLPESILCLTFTESGATAMRERLIAIIGADAYKVAIHTFHSFGSDIISRYPEYFYNGAFFRPADELSSYEILRSILDELDYNNPLASKMNGEFTHLSDILRSISELKRSGLTSDELLNIVDSNETALLAFEAKFVDALGARITKSTAATLAPLAQEIATYPVPSLPPSVQPLANVLALSLAHVLDEVADTESTKPLTAWKNKWFEKNEHGQLVFKDHKRHKKLRALAHIYFQYLQRMQEESLYDFDDMVLRVVHALEVFPELRYSLQEKYLYLLVDEFQDTNAAQARILKSLSTLETGDAPNIMVVGDDDQAIYSFQGAEVGNILDFRTQYEAAKHVTLRDNYRSANTILEHARDIITQGHDRLENYIPDLNKALTAHHAPKKAAVTLHEYESASDERRAVVQAIQTQLNAGVKPESIAIIARRHTELMALLPYLHSADIALQYERRDNVLELAPIKQLTLLATCVAKIAANDISGAQQHLPEILAHPAWGFTPEEIWKLSLAAHKNNSQWLEEMAVQPRFSQLHEWLVATAGRSLWQPAEQLLDELMGVGEYEGFTSPLHGYFFSKDLLQTSFDDYLTHLEALRAIRTKLREYQPTTTLKLADFVEFIRLHTERDASIQSIRVKSDITENAIHLLTGHKSKGLEFDHVYIIGAEDNRWGEKARSKSRTISYPENLPLMPSGDTLDERLRLFYVAMTRARTTLHISYSRSNDANKTTLLASFLSGNKWQPTQPATAPSAQNAAHALQLEWHYPLTHLPRQTMKELLAPMLAHYKLSATHLNTFLDVTRGGPQHFLLNNLLRFPQAMSANAAYGSAIHRTLQQAHTHVKTTGKKRPIEDIVGDFAKHLSDMRMADSEYEHFLLRGTDALSTFLAKSYASFSADDLPELNFSHQQSRLGQAHLTGSLDVARVDLENKTIAVTDYKTGTASTTWHGKTDYEKIKLHKYRQQLMFYKLLVEHSRDFAGYTVEEGTLTFVEPTNRGEIAHLLLHFDTDELQTFTKLVLAVWQKIQALDLPDTSAYEQSYKGMLAFEADLLDGKV